MDEATPTLRDNVIHNVINSDDRSAPHIIDNELGGTWAQIEAAPLIEGNHIDYANNGGADGSFSVCGIEASDPDARPTITGNTIRNANTGICLGAAHPIEASGNELIDNKIGISLSRTEASVTDHTITGDGAGVVVISGGSPAITGNTIDVGGRGVSVGNRATPVISDNVICGGEVRVFLSDEAEPTLSDNETC